MNSIFFIINMNYSGPKGLFRAATEGDVFFRSHFDYFILVLFQKICFCVQKYRKISEISHSIIKKCRGKSFFFEMPPLLTIFFPYSLLFPAGVGEALGLPFP